MGDLEEPIVLNELILIPSNTPHAWIWDRSTLNKDYKIEEYTLKIDIEVLYRRLSLFLEFLHCVHFFENLNCAIKILGSHAKKIIRYLEEMKCCSPAKRLILFLDIVVEICANKQYCIL